jgi:hypothetical protein
MAGVSFTFSDFQPRLTDALHSMGLSEQQVRQAHRRGLTAMGAWMTREMRNALKPDGGQRQPGSNAPWKPLSEPYLIQKQNEGRPTHIGIHMGHMQNSLSFDVRASMGEVESGPTVEHAEGFDRLRPLTPKEDYASAEFAEIVVDAYKAVSR